MLTVFLPRLTPIPRRCSVNGSLLCQVDMVIEIIYSEEQWE